MRKPSRNRNSVKIILDFTGVSRLSGNNSVIPFLTAAKKRHFYPPKLPALRAEVDGLAQKSARPFSCLLAAASKIPRFCPFRRVPTFVASGRSRPFRCISSFDRTRCAGLRSNFCVARRRNVRFWVSGGHAPGCARKTGHSRDTRLTRADRRFSAAPVGTLPGVFGCVPAHIPRPVLQAFARKTAGWRTEWAGACTEDSHFAFGRPA